MVSRVVVVVVVSGLVGSVVVGFCRVFSGASVWNLFGCVG